MLTGSILAASLYDRALSSDEVSAAARGATSFVTERQLIETMTETQRHNFEAQRAELGELRKQLNSIPDSKLGEYEQAWAELAHAIISFKEFIYVR